MFIRVKKYELSTLVILVIILLRNTIFHIFFESPKVSYKVVADRRIIDTTIEDFRIEETQDFLINTPGCYIPNYAKTFKYKRSVKKIRNINGMCGKRYIFIDTIGNDTVQFRMLKYTEKEITCCYRYVGESATPGHELDRLSYTPCEVFTNNSKAWFKQEVITVTCRKGEDIIYKDTYVMLKKSKQIKKKSENDNKTQWNVLMIGFESMSRTRVFDTMPKTTKYLKEHKWLDFKAYQKVETNTCQNIVSVLAGKRIYDQNCTTDLFKFADYFIWKKYKDADYITAYGESNLLSNTFGCGFKTRPTDHYMRPSLFSVASCSSNILCTGRKPSASHLLDYAYKFVDSYKTNHFFGFFWINTYASYDNTTELSDQMILNFFKKLYISGVLNNTFVIFVSDQGPSFGEMSLLTESHYDNQLPMLFLWTPLDFRRSYTTEHYNLQVNQERLITPYDVYLTLSDIHKLSINSSVEIQSEGCAQCTSLLEKISPNRTCTDIDVGEYWCSCHNMLRIDTDIERAENSILFLKEHLQKIWKSIKTLPCTSCEQSTFLTIIRTHKYYQDEKTYYVIAFHMFQNELKFEAVVEHYRKLFRIMSLRTLTQYNDLGNCALRSHDRPFCVCAFDTDCFPEPIVTNNLDVLDPSYMKAIGVQGFNNIEDYFTSL